MNKTKLKIENFLSNKLENQIMIVGGGNKGGVIDPIIVEIGLGDESGGGTVSTGNGSGDVDPKGGELPPIEMPAF